MPTQAAAAINAVVKWFAPDNQLFRRSRSLAALRRRAAIFALFHTSGLGVPAWLLAVVAGGALWTLVEYLVHRVIYHRVPIFKRYHMAHHTEPKAYIGAPPGLATGVVFLASFAPLAPFVPIPASGVSAGMLLGYMTYSLVHYALHAATPARGSYLYRAWLHASHSPPLPRWRGQVRRHRLVPGSGVWDTHRAIGIKGVAASKAGADLFSG